MSDTSGLFKRSLILPFKKGLKKATSQSKVRVAIMQDEVTKVVHLRVKLESITRPGCISNRDVVTQGRTRSSVESEVGLTGAALAEYQCEQYGDAHDPSACSKAAIEAFQEAVKKFEAGGGDVKDRAGAPIEVKAAA